MAHRYFAGTKPLTDGGAVIGCCYPGGAKDAFGLAYRERDGSGSALATLMPFFASSARYCGPPGEFRAPGGRSQIHLGDQSKPFLLVKSEWGIDANRIRGAHDVHPILAALRDRLAAS